MPAGADDDLSVERSDGCSLVFPLPLVEFLIPFSATPPWLWLRVLVPMGPGGEGIMGSGYISLARSSILSLPAVRIH